MPTCFQMARSQLAASHPASQHTRKRYENGTETRNNWFRAPVAHCEAQSGGGRQGRKLKKMETETEKNKMFCFSFSWPFGTPTEIEKMTKKTEPTKALVRIISHRHTAGTEMHRNGQKSRPPVAIGKVGQAPNRQSAWAKPKPNINKNKIYISCRKSVARNHVLRTPPILPKNFMPKGQRYALAKLFASGGFGTVMMGATPDNVYFDLGEHLTLKEVDFQLRDYKGAIVPLLAPISFQLIFEC